MYAVSNNPKSNQALHRYSTNSCIQFNYSLFALLYITIGCQGKTWLAQNRDTCFGSVYNETLWRMLADKLTFTGYQNGRNCILCYLFVLVLSTQVANSLHEEEVPGSTKGRTNLEKQTFINRYRCGCFGQFLPVRIQWLWVHSPGNFLVGSQLVLSGTLLGFKMFVSSTYLLYSGKSIDRILWKHTSKQTHTCQ